MAEIYNLCKQKFSYVKIEPDFVTKAFTSDDFRKFYSKSCRYPIYDNPRKQN